MMKKIYSLILFLLVVHLVHAQEKQLNTLVKKFDAYRIKALQEKMYAHLDRTFYLTGETLWFKIYNVDGSFHKPINVSSVAYVEILDKGNLSVLQAKVELNQGSGNGSFFLPASLSSGHYSFRVYTNWMKNFSPEFFFEEKFTIVNPFIKPPTETTRTPPLYSAEFFPEGGNLVSGIRSKIAFKFSNASGRGFFGKGFILNQLNDTLCSFTPTKFGIGNFLFTPTDNEKYRVVVKDEWGNTSVHAFPEVHRTGYVLQLKDTAESVTINITNKDSQEQLVYLFIHSRQIIINASVHVLKGNRAFLTLKKSELPDGISHVTLFNDQLQPLCERLFFKHPVKHLQIRLQPNQLDYNRRRKVGIAIQTNSEAGKYLPANLSMTVYKSDTLESLSHTGIFHHMWLKADLRGEIESPGFYFNTNDPVAREGMDNLMLTHGWRRFNWNDVLHTNPEFKFIPEHNGHIITGVVTEEGIKQRGVLTYLASPGNIIRVYGSRSNQEGEVYYEIKDFYGQRQVIIQSQADSTRMLNIALQNPFFSTGLPNALPPFTISTDAEKKLLTRSMAMQVQDIYYYEQFGNRFLAPQVDSTAFYGKADATYFLDDYTRFQVMEEVMREYVPGVFVRKRRDGFHFILVDVVNTGVLDGDPMVLLDGVPVFDIDDIMKVDPLKVKKLEVVKRQYYLGPAVFPGIVSYTTYEGDLGGLKLDPKSVSLNYDGLQLKREFYHPQYENETQRNNRMPDQRYLLYWNPDITTDQEGKAQIEFYTSDVEGEYIVVVEGLTNDGNLGSTRHTFSVKPQGNQ